MKFTQTRKLILWGNSFGVTLNTRLMKEKGFKAGDLVKVDVELLESQTKEIKSYKCSACEYHFDSDDEIVECPACGNDICNLIIENNEKEVE